MIRKTAPLLDDRDTGVRARHSGSGRWARPLAGDLDVAECWRLLLAKRQGRLATSAGDWIELVTLDYLVHEATIMFRTPVGSTFEAPRRHEVAFEVDGEDSRWHWSVEVHGKLDRLAAAPTVMTSAERRLGSWCPWDKFAAVRLTPEMIMGHRTKRNEFHRSSVMA